MNLGSLFAAAVSALHVKVNAAQIAQDALDLVKPAAQRLVASYIDRLPDDFSVDQLKTLAKQAVARGLQGAAGHVPGVAAALTLLLDQADAYIDSLPADVPTVDLKAKVVTFLTAKIGALHV